MQPPEEGVEPATGDIVPYPGSALNLGAGKWLLATGEITSKPRGRRVELTEQTHAYWERVSQNKHGKPLSELIV